MNKISSLWYIKKIFHTMYWLKLINIIVLIWLILNKSFNKRFSTDAYFSNLKHFSISWYHDSKKCITISVWTYLSLIHLDLVKLYKVHHWLNVYFDLIMTLPINVQNLSYFWCNKIIALYIYRHVLAGRTKVYIEIKLK